MAQNLSTHTYGNAFCTHYKNKRQFCTETDRLFCTAVIAWNILRNFRIVENVARYRAKTAFNVSGSSRTVAGIHISIVSLLVYENFLICKVYKRRVNGSISVRVIRCNITADFCNFCKPSVVLFKKSMQNAPLNRFQSVYNFRNCTIPNNITCILNEIRVKKIFYVSHFPTRQYLIKSTLFDCTILTVFRHKINKK